MGWGRESLYPRAGDRVTGIAPATPVNIALVKVFARLASLHPGVPRGSVERSLRAGCMSAAPPHHFHPKFTFAQLRSSEAFGTQPFFCLHLARDMSPLLTQSRGRERMNAVWWAPLIRFDIPVPSAFSVNIQWDCPAGGWHCLRRQTNERRELGRGRMRESVTTMRRPMQIMHHRHPPSFPPTLLSDKNARSSLPLFPLCK